MSFNGIVVFEKNLRKLMSSDAFKKADSAQQLNLGYRLLKSKYGLGAWFGFGPVRELPEEDHFDK